MLCMAHIRGFFYKRDGYNKISVQFVQIIDDIGYKFMFYVQ